MIGKFPLPPTLEITALGRPVTTTPDSLSGGSRDGGDDVPIIAAASEALTGRGHTGSMMATPGAFPLSCRERP